MRIFIVGMGCINNTVKASIWNISLSNINSYRLQCRKYSGMFFLIIRILNRSASCACHGLFFLLKRSQYMKANGHFFRTPRLIIVIMCQWSSVIMWVCLRNWILPSYAVWVTVSQIWDISTRHCSNSCLDLVGSFFNWPFYIVHSAILLRLLPFMATSRYVYFPLCLLPVMATSRYVYFPLWLLPFMATSRYGYFPLCLFPFMATSLYGYFPLWLLPFMATSRYGYFPLRLLPVTDTSRYGYFPSRILPVTATSRYGYFPLRLLPVTATSRYGYFPLRLLPVTATSRYGYFPLRLLPVTDTSLYGHFPLRLLPVTDTSRYVNFLFPLRQLFVPAIATH